MTSEFETIQAEHSEISTKLSGTLKDLYALFSIYIESRAKLQEACPHKHTRSEAVFTTYEGYDGTYGDISCRVCGRRGKIRGDQTEWWPINSRFSLDDYLHGRTP